MATRRRIDPLNIASPIAQDNGRPSAEFMRQWNSQVAFNEEVDTDFTIIQERLDALEAIEIGGDGTHITPVPVPLSDGTNITLTLPDQADVTAGEYGAADSVPVVTVNAKGVITDISEVAISPTLSDSFLSYTLKVEDGTSIILDIGGGELLDLCQAV